MSWVGKRGKLGPPSVGDTYIKKFIRFIRNTFIINSIEEWIYEKKMQLRSVKCGNCGGIFYQFESLFYCNMCGKQICPRCQVEYHKNIDNPKGSMTHIHYVCLECYKREMSTN